MADIYGRKKILLLGIGGYTIAYYSFAWRSAGLRFPIAFGFALEGITSSFSVSILALLADLSNTEEERTKSFNRCFLIGQLSEIVANVGSGYVLNVGVEAFYSLWIMCGACSLCAFLFTTFLLHDKRSNNLTSESKSLRSMSPQVFYASICRALHQRTMLQKFLMSVVFLNIGRAIKVTFPAMTMVHYNWRAGDIALLNSVVSGLQIVCLTAYVFLDFEKRVPVATLVRFGALFTFAYGLLQLASPISSLFFVVPQIMSAAIYITMPAEQAFLSLRTSADEQATVLSLSHFAQNVTTSISVYIASNYLFTDGNPLLPFLMAVCAYAIFAVLRFQLSDKKADQGFTRIQRELAVEI
eukprot:GEMP01034036.1.p1 GENE.GEMP01034036.1~~GEMP01034036.1.p1  ORF type:complete len:355 (+),score=67.86 GEMP01034036.1:442-1506(+)